MSFAESLSERTDANGTIPWKLAARAASLHGLLIDFFVTMVQNGNGMIPNPDLPSGLTPGSC